MDKCIKHVNHLTCLYVLEIHPGKYNIFKIVLGRKSFEIGLAINKTDLHHWINRTMVGYDLIRLLILLKGSTVKGLSRHSPWREESPND